MSAVILGISAFYHDSAAALLKDGEIVAAAQEERFTRRKFDPSFPSQAIRFCLREAGLSMSEVNYACFYEKPLDNFARILETNVALVPQSVTSFVSSTGLWARTKIRMQETIMAALGDDFRGELCFTDHHESHAASAFYPSPFEEAAILTLDAVGGWGTSSIGTGVGREMRLLQEMRFPHSLGMLYSAFTYYTGFKVNSGEYKLMGLAPYGEPKYVALILDTFVDLKADGSLWLDMSYFNYCQGLTMTSNKFHELFGGPPRDSESTITQKHMDLAASVQKICEEAVLRSARHAHRITEMQNLTMAGGVALNCVANGRLLREGPYQRLWVQPSAGDAGGALGSALLVWHQLLKRPRQVNPHDSQQGSLLGPEFSDTDIKLYLDSIGARYHFFENEPELLDGVSKLIAQEKVIGWFQGRMEYGPRALGCRSIIGDARSPRLQSVMNLKVKFRESFRPFAPCVLSECVGQVVEMEPSVQSPYMLIVASVQEAVRLPLGPEEHRLMQDPDLRVRVSVPRSTLPAITHVDYSARIQTVDEARHGRFYRLMKRFYDQTGCPVLINSSFNIRGEPIVCLPDDAYRCFMATDMDCLVMERFLLLKEEQPEELTQDSTAYQAQYALD
jgi:carbamoyltransferase